MEDEAKTAGPGAGAGAEGATRQPRRGPAPIASFDHDGSDEVRPDSSPETKQTFRLPEIVEHPAGSSLAAPSGRARSHSTPGPGGALPPPAPRIDISRASSSSHHDSRDSSPELALFAGDAADSRGQRLELGFREDGALELRSSTEELSFLEPAPGEPRPPAPAAPPPPAPPLADRRHSRKDSQSSEVALLGVSGRTSRLSSVGSACSAQSGVSRVSRLSVVSGVSRSPSPHRMLLETSFCGPKPIETDPEACTAAVAERILEMAKMTGERATPAAAVTSPASAPDPHSPPAPTPAPVPAVDARDHREVRTEVTVEAARPATGSSVTPASAVPRATRQPALALSPVMAPAPKVPTEKTEKETKNRARTEERKPRPRVRREPSEPEVYKSRNKSKDIIRIKLRPDDEEEDEGDAETARKPASLALGATAAPAPAPQPPSPALSRRRSPSPLGPPSVSRKSSFCSLFKSRETIGSPDSPQAQEALRRKRSLTEGRARSKSRDRSATPTSSKIRGSVLSLFRTPRKSAASSSPGSRATSPAPAGTAIYPTAPSDPRRAQQDKLKYYEEAKNGVIHIPLRTPPEEREGAGTARRSSGVEAGPSGIITTTTATAEASRPASAPQPRESVASTAVLRAASTVQSRAPPVLRTVLPDGSIIIPLHSPTERLTDAIFPETTRPKDPSSPEPRPTSRRDDIDTAPSRVESVATSISSAEAAATSTPPEPRPKEPEPVASPSEQPPPEVTSKRRKERLVFTTQVGSREQFSITKTPSVASEISGSFPSFDNGELRDTHITADPPPPSQVAADTPSVASGGSTAAWVAAASAGGGSGALTPQDPPRDSSESEPSSETAPPQAGNDVERRGLVIQESFEEELPYVPTTLPQERSVAVPMVPIRDRGGVLVRSVQRPRAAPPTATATVTVQRPRTAPPATSRVSASPPAPVQRPRQAPPVTSARATHSPAQAAAAAAAAAPAEADKLRIKLPRRPKLASVSTAPRPSRERTRSGGGDSGGESRAKQEWIDFEEVPERRKQPKRIQTLPVGAADGAGADASVVFSYVEPEHCRCECHAHAHAHADDQLPLLDDMQQSRISSSSAECGEEEPFTRDLDLRHEAHAHLEQKGHP